MAAWRKMQAGFVSTLPKSLATNFTNSTKRIVKFVASLSDADSLP